MQTKPKSKFDPTREYFGTPAEKIKGIRNLKIKTNQIGLGNASKVKRTNHSEQNSGRQISGSTGGDRQIFTSYCKIRENKKLLGTKLTLNSTELIGERISNRNGFFNSSEGKKNLKASLQSRWNITKKSGEAGNSRYQFNILKKNKRNSIYDENDPNSLKNQIEIENSLFTKQLMKDCEKQIPKLDQLSKLNQIDKLHKLDKLDKIEKIEKIEKMDKMDKKECFEIVSFKENLRNDNNSNKARMLAEKRKRRPITPNSLLTHEKFLKNYASPRRINHSPIFTPSNRNKQTNFAKINQLKPPTRNRFILDPASPSNLFLFFYSVFVLIEDDFSNVSKEEISSRERKEKAKINETSFDLSPSALSTAASHSNTFSNSQ
jgi:hypothetical protein